MLEPLFTLAFLSALWLSAAVIGEMLARSNSRIAAALRGETPAIAKFSVVIRSRPARSRMERRQPMRAQPQLRAAA